MRTYHHFYPTCPLCHEPHVSGSALERNENDLRCSSCGAYFRKDIDLVSSGKFPKTIDTVIRSEGGDARDFLSRIPLPWEVKLNIIEEEYVSWVKEIESGRFLITWPWRDVKFIPILLGEYLLNNPDKKAAVVGEIRNNFDDLDVFDVPAVDEVFNYLIYTESSILKEIDKEIKKEMNKLNFKHIFKKKRVVYYKISELGSRKHFTEDICFNTFRKCKNKIKKEIENDLGKDSIRKLKTKKFGMIGWKDQTINENGFIDIKLEEREQWTGRKLSYKNQWLWNVLLNSGKFKRLSKEISAVSLKGQENMGTGSERLYFISSEIEPWIIFRLVKSIRPHMVVIQNVDDFMKDAVFRGERSRALSDFLASSENTIVLMFSINPDVRHLYCINYSGEYATDYSVDNYGIIPHTWDSEIIVEKIKSRFGAESEQYPAPVSSRFEELTSTGTPPEFEYIQINSLDLLDDLIEEVTSLVDGNISNDVKRYIYDLRKTPLLLKGDYRNPEVFSRRGRSSDQEITYEYLISLIYGRCDEERFEKIKGSIERIYITESDQIMNPIMEKMCEKISELLQNEGVFITVVVHRYDVRGTEKLLCSRGYEDYIPQKLVVCSWSDLSWRERELGEKDHYVISTLPPSFEYPISSSMIRKIIFVGGKRFTERIETIIKHRLTEQARRPLYLLLKDDPAPILLRETLEDTGIPSNDIIRNLTDETVVEFEESIGRSYYSANRASYHPVIKPGEKAILVVDTGGIGVFIPEGTSLLVMDDGKLDELEVGDISSDKKLLRELIGKEILLDRRGLYSSFREDFIKFMVEYGKQIKFKKGPYHWNGFYNLFTDASQWIDIIRMAINEYSYRNKISYEEAENKISEYLSSLGLTAKDPRYIKSWWSRYDVIFTETGSYYLYRVEHPKSRDDLVAIYNGIRKLLPELEIDPADAYKCYAASIVIQHFRRSVLKGEIQKISSSLRRLYSQISDEINNILERAERFKVNLVYVVDIAKEVEPFKLMEDFKNYIGNQI